MVQQVKLSSEKLFLVQSKKFWNSQNEIGFLKHQFEIQRLTDLWRNWEERLVVGSIPDHDQCERNTFGGAQKTQ